MNSIGSRRRKFVSGYRWGITLRGILNFVLTLMLENNQDGCVTSYAAISKILLVGHWASLAEIK